MVRKQNETSRKKNLILQAPFVKFSRIFFSPCTPPTPLAQLTAHEQLTALDPQTSATDCRLDGFHTFHLQHQTNEAAAGSETVILSYLW